MSDFTPPFPAPPARDLSLLQLLLVIRRNSLAAWPACAYRELAVRRRFLGRDYILLNDPAAVRHVLRDVGEHYKRPVSSRRLLRPATGNGLLVSDGPAWRAQRRMLAPSFAPRDVDLLLPAMAEAGEAMLGELRGRPRAKLGEVLERAAIDSVGRAMFGLQMAARAPRIGGLLRGYFAGAAKPQIFDHLAEREGDYAWASRGRRAFSRAWFAEVDKLIVARRALPPGNDVFTLLVAAEAAGHGAVRDQIGALLTAGFETTAQAMFWAIFLLAQVTEEQEAVRQELRAQPPGALRRAAEMAAWPRLRAAFFEAMRLYPASSVFVRIAEAPDIAAGIEIPRGATVIVSPWVMQRHAALWEAPAAFRPARFAGMSPAAALSQHGYIPFGTGPRGCIGAAFALTEALLLLAQILVHYRISLEPGETARPVALISTRPHRQPWFRLSPA